MPVPVVEASAPARFILPAPVRAAIQARRRKSGLPEQSQPLASSTASAAAGSEMSPIDALFKPTAEPTEEGCAPEMEQQQHGAAKEGESDMDGEILLQGEGASATPANEGGAVGAAGSGRRRSSGGEGRILRLPREADYGGEEFLAGDPPSM